MVMGKQALMLDPQVSSILVELPEVIVVQVFSVASETLKIKYHK